MRLYRGLLCAVLALSSLGISQELKSHDQAYRLQCSDVLEIHYRYTPEFNQTVSVGPDGQATILGLGTIRADGLTVDEFRAQLVKLSSTRLVDPDISILLKEYVKPYVFVGGEVNSPGRFEMHGRLTALDAVALAGGMKNTARTSEVLILRKDSDQTRVIDLKKLINDHKLEEAPDLRAGDVIYVTQSTFSKVERIIRLGQFGVIYTPFR